MYQFLFRSRWFALAWGVVMAISAALFTTTGAGAIITGTGPKPSASEDSARKQRQSRELAEDEQAEEPIIEPGQNTAPFAASDNDSIEISEDE